MALKQSQIRNIIVLRGFGFKQDEIAYTMRISRHTVSKHLQILKQESEDKFKQGMSLDDIYVEALLGY